MELTEQNATRPITVTFRYDDYSSTSDTETELRVYEAFSDANISCLVGAIPLALPELSPLSSEKAEYLRNAVRDGKLELALHGYTHEATSPKCEFAGLSLSDQVDRVREGKRILEDSLDTDVTMFIPPWNRFDANTVVALEREGCDLISGHKLVTDSWPERSTVKYLPASCKPQHLRDAVASARKVRDCHCIIGVVVHEFNFVENNAREGRMSLGEFHELLKWIKSQPDVRVKSYRECAESGADLSVARCRANCHKYPAKLLPNFLGTRPNERLYLSIPAAQLWRSRAWLFTGSYYVLSLGGLLGVAYVTARRCFRWCERLFRKSKSHTTTTSPDRTS